MATRRFVYANEAFSRISGYGAAELMFVFELVPSGNRTASRERLSRRLGGQGDEDRLDNIMLHRSGWRVDLEPGVELLREHARPVIGARDISERKSAERRLNTQYAAALTLEVSSTLEEAAPKVLEYICESLE